MTIQLRMYTERVEQWVRFAGGVWQVHQIDSKPRLQMLQWDRPEGFHWVDVPTVLEVVQPAGPEPIPKEN
jgi:hypothetical protein